MMLELRRADAFPRADLMRATMLAEFASRAVENDRLIGEARDREEERTRLTESLITAEQDERRRLSIFLHDGPLQSMSGIALMHDAALAALEEGRIEDATKVIRTSLERERDTIRTLRDLSFAIEPLVLRDRGFAAAVDALVEQIEGAHDIRVDADVDAGEGLAEKAQVALYQLIREAVNQSVHRNSKRIAITVAANGEGFTTEIVDDGTAERRRGGIDELDERVRVLSGRVSVETTEGARASGSCCRPTWAPQPSRIRPRWRATRKPGTSSSSRSPPATSWSSARAKHRPRAPRSRRAISASRSRRSARHRCRATRGPARTSRPSSPGDGSSQTRHVSCQTRTRFGVTLKSEGVLHRGSPGNGSRRRVH